MEGSGGGRRGGRPDRSGLARGSGARGHRRERFLQLGDTTPFEITFRTDARGNPTEARLLFHTGTTEVLERMDPAGRDQAVTVTYSRVDQSGAPFSSAVTSTDQTSLSASPPKLG